MDIRTFGKPELDCLERSNVAGAALSEILTELKTVGHTAARQGGAGKGSNHASRPFEAFHVAAWIEDFPGSQPTKR